MDLIWVGVAVLCLLSMALLIRGCEKLQQRR